MPTRAREAEKEDRTERTERLQRVMAAAGVASRRRCEELIEHGAVEVNGRVVRELPVFVDPERDRITVEGRPLPRPERHIYLLLNKPERTLTTVTDANEFGGTGGARRTVMDLVDHPARARLFPVGRLDYDTRGLVLITNDGDLANRLTHPRFGVHKTYEAVVKGRLEENAIESLEKGIYLAERREGQTVGAKRTAHVKLKIIRRDRERTIVEMTLAEGRNRQVRRMFASVGHPVKKLTRVGMGPLRLKGVAAGAWRELTAAEIRALRRAADLADRTGRGKNAAARRKVDGAKKRKSGR